MSETIKKITKSEQTRNKIETVYLDLISEKRWDKITVKELCSHANITRGTFYQYYGDIYDLMESIQSSLLEEITALYKSLANENQKPFRIERFPEEFDHTPPQQLISWFDFCKEHHQAMEALLDPINGDSYFVKKLKSILNKYINSMMDADGQPNDELRSHFVKIFSEMHFLAARSWLESDEPDFLSVQEIVSLLNTMRIGAAYLSYKNATTPDFDTKIPLPSPSKN